MEDKLLNVCKIKNKCDRFSLTKKKVAKTEFEMLIVFTN